MERDKSPVAKETQKAKKVIEKISGPFIETGKGWLGRTLYKKATSQSGVKGVISKELAGFLKNKGWYK